ncbi:YcxB family protein [Streptomyces sp. NPDC098789]|uniref:YcxB family protein n=1 Tax=Streptomyces sp. NPDC098789 TaxID=3366098 RepID=UPI0037F8FA79
MDTGGDQAHDMSAGAGDGGAERSVELVYRPTTQDLAEALRARARHTGSGRFQRWLLLTAGLLITLVSGLSLFAKGPFDASRLLFPCAGLLMLALAFYGPQLTARTMGGLLAKMGEARAVVGDAGVRVTTAGSETRIAWALQPTYVETPATFVMLSDDKRSVAMTVLPKRGVADPADLERLRAILDRNLRRR